MILAFTTAELRDLCASPTTADQKYGRRTAAALRARIADLRAARHALELPATVERLQGDPPCLRVLLPKGHVMTWQVNQSPLPLADGKIDWARVRRVKLLSIDREGNR